MKEAKRCRSCGYGIPEGRETCPSCFAVVQPDIVSRLVKADRRDSDVGNDKIPYIIQDVGKGSILFCLLDISFNRFITIRLSSWVYVFALLLTIILTILGFIATGEFYFSELPPHLDNYRVSLTFLAGLASLLIPLIFLTIVRVLMEFALAAVKTAQNTGKIVDVLRH